MKPLTRLQVLEKQNKDLRIRLENRQGKSELALSATEDEMKELRAQSSAKDKTIAMLQAGLGAMTAENDELRLENESLRDALQKAEDRAAKLEAMLKKNSSNSDRPPSSDPLFNKAKANSDKEKSGRNAGGQHGHKGHRLHPYPYPDIIVEKRPPCACPGCGGAVMPAEGYEARQIADIGIIVKVTEERSLYGQCAGCGRTVQGEFSDGFNSPVGYGPNVKAAVAMLNADSNVPIRKTALFISGLTEGKIAMSDGTVVNIVAELASRFEPAVEDIALALAACGVLNVDETGVRVSGSLAWMQIISNENYSLYGRSLKRGTPNEVMDSLIMLFTGVLVHDHLKSYYSRYAHCSHGECNTHGLRYLKAVTEIMKHPWAKAMAELLTEANKQKKELMEAGRNGMTDDELRAIRDKYIGILDQGQAEYAEAVNGKKNVTYYDEERRLLKRLREYADEHLRFLSDFSVPFSNNGAEHGARHIKGKQKTSGGFRSDKGVDNYGAIASVVASLRKHGMHVFSGIKNAFLGSGLCFTDAKQVDTG